MNWAGPVAGRAALQKSAEAFAAEVRPIAVELRAAGLSLRKIGAALDERGLRARRGGAWTTSAVLRLLNRPT